MKVKKLVMCTYGGDSTIYSTKLEYDHTYSDGSTKEPTIKLFASKKDASWTQKARGKLLGKLKCDGNGVDVALNCLEGRESFRLDYSELFELELLIKEYRLAMKDKSKIRRVVIK